MLLVVGLIAIGIVIALGARRTYLRYAGTSGKGVSVQSANQWLWPNLRIPDAASDVTYRADFGGCEAEFAITEDALLQWCRTKGWAIERISSISAG